jgi:hypothetical protein
VVVVIPLLVGSRLVFVVMRFFFVFVVMRFFFVFVVSILLVSVVARARFQQVDARCHVDGGDIGPAGVEVLADVVDLGLEPVHPVDEQVGVAD